MTSSITRLPAAGEAAALPPGGPQAVPAAPGATVSSIVRATGPVLDWTPLIVAAAHLVQPAHRRIVLHLAGDVTQSVYSFLRPITDVLAEDGAEQWVLMNAPRPGQVSREFDPRVRVQFVPVANGRSRAKWSAWRSQLHDLLARHPVSVIHAHGLTPALIASWALRRHVGQTRLFCSPHGSRWLGHGDGIGLAGRALTPLIRRLHGHLIVNGGRDARQVLRAARTRPPLVESPVDAAYFLASTPKTASPLVVAGVYDDGARAAERFAQLAVLLGNGEQQMQLAWINALGGQDAQPLNAAEVPILPSADPEARAALLSSAWVYVVPHAVHGHAHHITEALAAGTPCVAIDTPHHRDLIRDGVTGFICRTHDEMLDRIAVLVDEPTIARAMSQRAREIARERFAAEQFRSQVLHLYAADEATAAPDVSETLVITASTDPAGTPLPLGPRASAPQ